MADEYTVEIHNVVGIPARWHQFDSRKRGGVKISRRRTNGSIGLSELVDPTHVAPS
jgi:hypothetical protein